AQAALQKAGQHIVNPRLQDWYVALQKERIGVGALGEMMAGRMTPDEAIKKIQKYADDTRDDSSVKKYKR
ncbi:N-acetylglucosamine/diacetylchitobiose ABC transporter substrate-binding protein, partial [Streptomyces decoyicus]